MFGFDPMNPTQIDVEEPLVPLKQGNAYTCSVYFKNSIKCPQAAAFQSGDSFYCLRHSEFVRVNPENVPTVEAEEVNT